MIFRMVMLDFPNILNGHIFVSSNISSVFKYFIGGIYYELFPYISVKCHYLSQPGNIFLNSF